MQVFTPDCAITTFDTATPGVDEVELGEYFEVETRDCYDGQITGPEVLRPMIDMARFNRATGPIDIVGIRAGDWVRVVIKDITVGETGVMVLRPGIGILGADIEETSSLIVKITDGTTATIAGVQVPIRPMIGVIGVAADDPISSSTPGRHGGNMDTRIITAGREVLLRAQRDGAGLALGDLHAAQGDGELGGTGIEIAGTVRVRVERAEHSGTWPAVIDEGRLWVVASADTLEEATGAAFADVVGLVQATHDIPWGDAYRLASIVSTTHISQVVNPTVTVRIGIPPEHVPTATEENSRTPRRTSTPA